MTPRPSMRTPSSTMRLRTSFLVSERTAALISPARPSNSSPSCSWIDLVAASSASLRAALVVILLASARAAPPMLSTRSEDVVLVVGEGLVGEDRQRPAIGDEVAHEVALQVDRLADPELRRLEPVGQHLLGDLGRAVEVLLERSLGAARFDHHDGDVGVGVASLSARPATTSSKVAASPSAKVGWGAQTPSVV